MTIATRPSTVYDASGALSGGGGSGGALQEPSFDVNPAYGDGDWELEGTERDIQIYLINSADAPLGVTLSFSGDILEAVNFDSGSASSPSFVVPPTGGGANTQRAVTLRRGSGAPSSGNPSLDCSVSFTLADGSTSPFTQQITVHPFFLVHEVVEAIATPKIEYLFETLSNSGSAGSTYDLQASGSNFTVQADATAQGFTGSASTASSGTAGHLRAPLLGSDYFNTGIPRTWIWALTSNETTTHGNQFMNPDWDGYGAAVGFRADTTWMKLSYRNGSNSRIDASINTSSGNATHYGTDGVADANPSEGLETAVNRPGETMILAVTFDPNPFPNPDGTDSNATTGYFRAYFKWSGDGAGFSGRDFTTSHATTTNNSKPMYGTNGMIAASFAGLIGNSSESSSSNAYMSWRYFGVIDSMITPVDFKNILQAAGMLS